MADFRVFHYPNSHYPTSHSIDRYSIDRHSSLAQNQCQRQKKHLRIPNWAVKVGGQGSKLGWLKLVVRVPNWDVKVGG